MSSTAPFDYAVVGGGIVGLSTALALAERRPRARILVLEKESAWARHQTGNNSGVIHSGIYYKPGSHKARFARAGSRSMVEFCREQGIPHEVCGKVIVATEDSELPALRALYQRGLDNGLDVRMITPEELREIEPHARCVAAVRVPSTGIVSYSQVCQRIVQLATERGATLQLSTRVTGFVEDGPDKVIQTAQAEYRTRFLVNCGGLHSDRLARMDHTETRARIVPFRGEYFELAPEKRHLCRTLIYPVPNPAFPFLGVHFTRMIDGSVHCGPNAVLAFEREGYRKLDFSLRDFSEVMCFPGFWKLAWKYHRDGMDEIWRSLSKAAFVRSLQRLIPEVREEDCVPSHAGVRAQALMHDGSLVDDFLIIPGRNSMHVCNAPSPAATASLEIGAAIAGQVP